MTKERRRNKKNPRYLEDITLSLPSPVFDDNENPFSSNLFLGRYDEEHLMALFRSVGIVAILKEKGYHNLIVSVLKQDNYTSRLFVNFDSVQKETRLIELIVREGVFKPKKQFLQGYDFSGGLPMLLIEWLSLQDPRSTFSVEKPRLPGQEYPGLGGLKNLQALLFRFARSASKDAIVDIPEYYHAAVIYSRLYQDIYSRRYSFFSPVDAGNFQAMMRDLNDKPLADVSFAVAFDCLVDTKTGKKVQWKPSDQIYPISKTLKQYFVNEQYTDIVAKTAEKASYSIDWKKFEQVRTQGMIDEI